MLYRIYSKAERTCFNLSNTKHIKISLDQALDIPDSLSCQYDIGIAEATVMLSGKPYLSVDPETLFEHVDSGGTASTTAVNIAEYEESFDKWLKEYDEIVHITLSNRISANHQNALIAADGRPVYIVDSLSLSSGGALLALEGAKMRDAGTSASDIARSLAAMALKLDCSFVLSTLKYMAKGGRCSSVAALGANILKLKPCIEVKMPEGVMDVGKKYRGTLDTALLQYVLDKLSDTARLDISRPIFITHSVRTPDSAIEAVRSKIKDLTGYTDIYECTASGTISVHCGPGTLGILFFTV